MSRGVALSIAAVLAAGGGAYLVLSGGTGGQPSDSGVVLPVVPVVRTAGADACKSCHAEIVAEWQTSPHGRTGIPLATPDGGADLAIGSSWMQAYLRKDASGLHRVVAQCFEIDTGKWHSVDDVMDAIQGPLMPEEHGQRPPRRTELRSFERDCSGCHVSGTRVRFDAESGQMKGGWRAASIDCEACHGAALAHVEAWAEMDDSEPLPDLERLDARTSTVVCARCHGGSPVGSDFTLEAAKNWIARPRTGAGVYSHGAATGQIYQADSFMRSACHLEGELTCSGCHQWHGGGLRHTEHADAMCTRCHAEEGTREHTHHASDNDGGRCVSCHMPRLLPGLLAHQRDHRISSPLPAVPETPDACTACHKDKDKPWAAEWTEKWWGPPDARTVEAIRGIELARGGDMQAARPYLERARTSPEPFYRWAAARWTMDASLIANDEFEQGRFLALEIAARRSDGEAILRKGLSDQSPVLRALAYVFLAQRGPVAMQPPLADLEIAARLSRELSAVRVMLARTYLARDRIADAIDLLEETVVFRDRDPDAWLVLAGAYTLARRDAAAAAAVRRWSPLVQPIQHLDALMPTIVNMGEFPLARAILASVATHLPDPMQRSIAADRRARFEAQFDGGAEAGNGKPGGGR